MVAGNVATMISLCVFVYNFTVIKIGRGTVKGFGHFSEFKTRCTSNTRGVLP